MFSLSTNNKKLELKVDSQRFRFCLTSSHLQEYSPSLLHIHPQALYLLLILLSRGVSLLQVFLSPISFLFPSVSSFCSFVLFLFSSSFLPSLFSSLPFFALVFFPSKILSSANTSFIGVRSSRTGGIFNRTLAASIACLVA